MASVASTVSMLLVAANSLDSCITVKRAPSLRNLRPITCSSHDTISNNDLKPERSRWSIATISLGSSGNKTNAASKSVATSSAGSPSNSLSFARSQ